jgi:hypothetical protein
MKSNSATTTLSKECPFCKKTHTMEFDAEALYSGLEKRKAGMRIQDAFPTFNPDQREFLLSGICSKCWDEM